jgi:hypothetical protein
MKMTNADERKRQIEERRAKTYHGHALHTDEDIYGGRFATSNTTTVVGTSPTVEYPAMPDGPWKNNPYPEEPLIDGRGEGDRLGYEIDRPDMVSTSAVEAASAPASEPSHVITDAGVARKFIRRF